MYYYLQWNLDSLNTDFSVHTSLVSLRLPYYLQSNWTGTHFLKHDVKTGEKALFC